MSGTVRYPHIFIEGKELKRCRVCKEYLPVELFSNQGKNCDGLRYECKKCKYEINKKYKKRQKYDHEKYKIGDYQKRYYEKNKKAILTKQHENYMCNKEKKKEYYKNHREKILERLKLYPKRKYGGNDYKLKDAIKSQKRENLKKQCIATLTVKDFKDSLKYFDNKDAYTGLPMKIVSQDHIIPLSKGGSYTRFNIIPCEHSINASKGNKNMETWYKEQPYFSEKRLNKIKKWMGYKPNSDILQTSFF